MDSKLEVWMQAVMTEKTAVGIILLGHVARKLAYFYFTAVRQHP